MIYIKQSLIKKNFNHKFTKHNFQNFMKQKYWLNLFAAKTNNFCMMLKTY